MRQTSDHPAAAGGDGGIAAALREGARDAFGMFVGSAIFGALFGSAAAGAGLEMPQAVAMSALIFAGTAQFSTLTLWQADPPLFAILVSAALVMSRLALMGLSLGPAIRTLPVPSRAAAVFLLNDAAWALSKARRGGSRPMAYYFGVSAPIYTIWVVFTTLGFVTAGLVDPVTAKALSFAGIIFLAILVGIVVRGVDAPRAPLAVSAIAAIALDGAVPPGPALLIAVAAGAAVAILQVRHGR
jgi:predicted branched-subunit amino acid permease